MAALHFYVISDKLLDQENFFVTILNKKLLFSHKKKMTAKL